MYDFLYFMDYIFSPAHFKPIFQMWSTLTASQVNSRKKYSHFRPSVLQRNCKLLLGRLCVVLPGRYSTPVNVLFYDHVKKAATSLAVTKALN